MTIKCQIYFLFWTTLGVHFSAYEGKIKSNYPISLSMGLHIESLSDLDSRIMVKNTHSVNILDARARLTRENVGFHFLNYKSFSNIGEKAFPVTYTFQWKVLSNMIFFIRHLFIFLGNRKQKPFLSTMLLLISQDIFLPILRSPAPCYAITYWIVLNVNISTVDSYHSHLPLPLG